MVGAVVIGTVPLLVRFSDVGTVAIAFWRMAIASGLIFGLLALCSTARTIEGTGDIALLATSGALFAADLAFFHIAIGKTSVANAALLNNLAPLFAGAAATLLGRRLRPIFWIGGAVAITGAAILLTPRLGISDDDVIGIVCGILSAVFFAGYLLIVERLRRRHGSLTVLAWGGAASAATLLPVALASGETVVPASVAGWAVIVALATLVHCGGQALMVYAMSHLSGPEAGIGGLLSPVSAAVLAALLLGEAITLNSFVGGLVVLAGVMIATAWPERS